MAARPQDTLVFNYRPGTGKAGDFFFNLFLSVIGLGLLCLGAYMVYKGAGMLAPLLRMAAEKPDWNGLFKSCALVLSGAVIFILPFFFAVRTAKMSKIAVKKGWFDNPSKRFVIQDKNGKTAYIPYQEICSIDLREEVRTTHSRHHTYRHYYYIVYFAKKDGAWWDLDYWESDRPRAEKLQADLRQSVDLAAAGDHGDGGVVLPSSIAQTADKDSVVFLWKTQIGPLLTFLTSLLLAVAGLTLLALAGLLITDSGGSLAGKIIIGLLCAAGGAGCLIGGGLTAFRALFHGNDFRLEINRQAVSLFRGGKLKKEMEFSKIARTQFSYDIMDGDVFSGETIHILTEEAAAKFGRLIGRSANGVETLASAKESLKQKDKAMDLQFSGLNMLDVLQFEKYLDATLRKMGGKVL